MEVITLETEAFKTLIKEITELKELLHKKSKDPCLEEEWLDNADVCKILKVGARCLQNYRDSGLAFSKIGNRIYYKKRDIEELLEKNYRKSF